MIARTSSSRACHQSVIRARAQTMDSARVRERPLSPDSLQSPARNLIPVLRVWRGDRTFPGSTLPGLPSARGAVEYLSAHGCAGIERRLENEEICISADVGVGAGGDGIVAGRSGPSSSSLRFREARCWRLRRDGLHRCIFRHPCRGLRPRGRSDDDKVCEAGQELGLSQRARGVHVSDDQIIDLGGRRPEQRTAGLPAEVRPSGPRERT